MTNQVETDYKALAAQINAKIKEAAAAMKAANDLATDAGLPGLTLNEYSYDDLDKDQIEAMGKFSWRIEELPLFDELDAAGWRTSSIGC